MGRLAGGRSSTKEGGSQVAPAENVAATEVLEREAVALENRSRSRMPTKGLLQDRSDACANVFEQHHDPLAKTNVVRNLEQATRVRVAPTLEAKPAASADPDIVRTSLSKAPSAAAEAVDAAEAKATVFAVTSDNGKNVVSLTKSGVAAAEVVRPVDLEVRRRKMNVVESRKAWAAGYGEWKAEAERLAGELGSSHEDVVDLQGELKAAVAMALDLVTSRRKAEEEAVAARRREAELRDELETAQAAIRTLQSTTNQAARSTEVESTEMQAALVAAQRERDAAIQSLLGVVHTRTSPVHQLPNQPVDNNKAGDDDDDDDDDGDDDDDAEEEEQEEESDFGSSGRGCDARCGQGDHSRWGYLELAAAQRDGEDLHGGELTRVLREGCSEVRTENANNDESSSFIRTSGETAFRSIGRSRTDERRAWVGAGGSSIGSCSSSGGSGKHVCRVCGAPAPSFRKLFDCRLNLGQALMEAAESQAKAASIEEETAAKTLKAEQQAESALAATREQLEQRLAAVEAAARAASLEARQTAARPTEVHAETCGRETGQESAAAAVAAAQREVEELVEVVATREGEIAALRTKLRLAEEDVETVRRETILGVHANSLVVVEAAKKKAAQANANAEVLDNRCCQQEKAIVSLTASRDDKADACRAVQESLVISEGRVQALKLEVSRLASLVEDADNNKIEKRQQSWDTANGGEVCSNSPTGRNDDDAEICRFDDGDTPELASKQRERANSLVSVLEVSLQAAREETKHLARRVTRLRAGLREAQQRGDRMEAAATSAQAVADAERMAAALATAAADSATARRHEAEQKATSAERCHREKVEALEAEVLRAKVAACQAREELAAAQGESSRLRSTVAESGRRMAMLEKNLALSTARLHEADAGRIRALVGRVRDKGREERAGREDEFSGSAAVTDEATLLPLEEGTSWVQAEVAPRKFSLEDSSNISAYEIATLRARLVASQAQHMELVRASEDTIACCYQRCEARVRAMLSAGKLAMAHSRNRGVAVGRESVLEAAGRLALVGRCFRALREEALIRSRDRSVRRQDRLQRWIREAFEKAGEEVSIRNYSQHERLRADGGAGGATLEDSASSFDPGTTASRCW